MRSWRNNALSNVHTVNISQQFLVKVEMCETVPYLGIYTHTNPPKCHVQLPQCSPGSLKSISGLVMSPALTPSSEVLNYFLNLIELSPDSVCPSMVACFSIQ